VKIKAHSLKQYLSTIDKYVATSITDVDGIILYVSRAFCDVAGYGEDELIGQNHSILRHPDMHPSIYEKLWGTITKGETWSGRLKNLKKNQEPYWVDAYIEPIFKSGSIIGYHAVRKNITNEKLYEKLAHTDPLTGLYNRTYMESFANLLIDESKRYDFLFSLIIFDLDDFKNVNDTFGHQAGDYVLKKVAEIATVLIRTSDRVGRWGGEEFLILLPQTSYTQAKELAEQLRIGFSIFHFDGVGSKTASFGVASLEADDTLFSLIAKADRALYKAKGSGKNRVC